MDDALKPSKKGCGTKISQPPGGRTSTQLWQTDRQRSQGDDGCQDIVVIAQIKPARLCVVLSAVNVNVLQIMMMILFMINCTCNMLLEASAALAHSASRAAIFNIIHFRLEKHIFHVLYSRACEQSMERRKIRSMLCSTPLTCSAVQYETVSLTAVSLHH